MNVSLVRAPTLLIGLLSLACVLRALFPPALDPGTPPPLCPVDQDCTFTPAKRAVILPRMLGAWLTLNQGPQHVLAASEYSMGPVRMSPLARIYPSASRIPAASTQAGGEIPGDPEQLLSMAPDAVLALSWMSTALERAGLPVVEMTNGDRSDPAMTNEWQRIAALAGEAARGRMLIAADAVNRQAVVDEVARLDVEPPRPRVLVMRRDRLGGTFYALSSGFLVTKQIPLLGGVDASQQSRTVALNKEHLYLLDPDIIFLPSWGFDGGGDDADPQDFYAEAAMQPLAAVRHRRVYRSPLFWAHMNGLAERSLMLRWMAELLYPDRMSRAFRAHFRDKYQSIYDYTLSDDEIDSIIHLEKNRDSAYYQRFARATCRTADVTLWPISAVNSTFQSVPSTKRTLAYLS